MKKLLIKAVIFILPIYFMVNTYLDSSEKYMIGKFGPSTEMQIEYSFKNVVKKDYDCLILGNSRIYRGLNPDRMSISTYNFAHDNDSFNQCYYKLQYLSKHNKKFKYLILGVDYTEFSYLADTRNYVYNKYFHEDYKKDFNEEEASEETKIFSLVDDKSFNQFMNDKFSRTVPIILQSVLPVEIVEEDQVEVNLGFIKDNGQFILEGKANENDTIDREYKRMPIQVSYFEKILEYTDKNNIKVFLVMPPMREGELKNFDDDLKKEHNEFIKNEIKGYGVDYIDYSEVSDFTTEDYTDIAHLNKDAADRLTVMIDQEVGKAVNGR